MLSKQDKLYIKSEISKVQSENNHRFSKVDADMYKAHILLEDIRSNLIKALGEGYDALHEKTQDHEIRITRLEKQA